MTTEELLGVFTKLIAEGGGGGGVEYVDSLPVAGEDNVLYVLSGGSKAQNQLMARGTGGDIRYFKCASGVSFDYDGHRNAYLVSMGPQSFYVPLGLALADEILGLSAVELVEEGEPYDVVAYGSSVLGKDPHYQDQGLLLTGDLDKDHLPDYSYLKSTAGSGYVFDVDHNLIKDSDGNIVLDLIYDKGLTNKIINMLLEGKLEVLENEEGAELVIETNRQSAIDETDLISVSIYGHRVFGGLYMFKDNRWVSLIEDTDLMLDATSPRLVQNRALAKKLTKLEKDLMPALYSADGTTDIDGYIIPQIALEDFLEIVNKTREGKDVTLSWDGAEGSGATKALYAGLDNNGTYLYMLYTNVGILKYTKPADDPDHIIITLKKFDDKPQVVEISGNSGTLSAMDYLELQTTNAQLKLADDDNILLNKCIDNDTAFSYSGMQVNSSSQVIGYTIVVSADKSWVKYKKTLG